MLFTGENYDWRSDAIYTSQPIHETLNQFYFEVEILNVGRNKYIALGFSTKNDSIAFNGVHGHIHHSENEIEVAGSSPFKTGDFLGCDVRRIHVDLSLIHI